MLGVMNQVFKMPLKKLRRPSADANSIGTRYFANKSQNQKCCPGFHKTMNTFWLSPLIIGAYLAPPFLPTNAILLWCKRLKSLRNELADTREEAFMPPTLLKRAHNLQIGYENEVTIVQELNQIWKK